MELITGLLVAAHALLGAVFLGGLIGRWIVLGLAERADTLATHADADPRRAARSSGSSSSAPQVVLVLGVVAAIAQGRPFLGPLQGARSIGCSSRCVHRTLRVLPARPAGVPAARASVRRRRWRTPRPETRSPAELVACLARPRRACRAHLRARRRQRRLRAHGGEALLMPASPACEGARRRGGPSARRSTTRRS